MSSFPPLTSTPYPSSHPMARQYDRAPWSQYVPAWTSTGSAPSIGNGTLLGRYRRSGTTLHLQQRLVIGSTTTVGSGNVRLGIPSGMTLGPIQQVGTSIWWDASTGIFTRGSCIGEAGGPYLYSLLADAVTPSDSSGLANGDVIIHGGTYEVAA